MKKTRNNKGQAMVEYIIIVVLIAITLIVLFSQFSKSVGENISGAANALSNNATDAIGEVDKIGPDSLKSLEADGSRK